MIHPARSALPDRARRGALPVRDHLPVIRGERRELRQRFANLVGNWTTLVRRQTRLTGFTAGYGHVSTLVPTLTGKAVTRPGIGAPICAGTPGSAF